MDLFKECEFDFIIILVDSARSKAYAFEFKTLSLASLFAASFPADMVCIMYNFRFCQLAHCGDIEIILRQPPNKAATIICFSHMEL